MVNRGKDFEAKFKEAWQNVCDNDAYIYRLHDVMNGFKASCNICDFVAYHYPFGYFLECKATNDSTLNFKSAIRSNQWDGLLEASKTPGVIAGVVVWFVKYDRTYFIDIRDMEKMKQSGVKSLKWDEVTRCIQIRGDKKRVFFDYDIADFLANSTYVYQKEMSDGWNGSY